MITYGILGGIFGLPGKGIQIGGLQQIVSILMGSIIILAVVSLIGNIISGKFRSAVNKIIPYVVVIIGILFILSGLALGIPYVSPRNRMLQPHEKMNKRNHCCPVNNFVINKLFHYCP